MGSYRVISRVTIVRSHIRGRKALLIATVNLQVHPTDEDSHAEICGVLDPRVT